ncbi:amidohydrolase [Clostridium carboxidivorans P7]|uniref:Amidohydrolase 3 n=1 Tax=Clostridium carboxidivorans P7 TaxID=536227 RepID=C6Q0N7_9CLOT|nr:amidohydrolase [Clostridium carboxidivorans]AKN31600.1 amidohydrolase [Clostridium carboxidivorans P7]EET84952.1 Amidohydrolase 3 [Clostridium carboxidivorans P7]EFG86986.1 amidohydrolase family protein [Clostridium carboxidivorans P7]
MKKHADSIYVSSAIFTGNSLEPMNGAIAIAGDRIIAVGSMDSMNEYIDDNTKVVDCGDKLIVPGFNDSHVHFMYGSMVRDEDFCLSLYDCTSEEECVKRVKEFADKHPNNPWIFGSGWNHNIWPSAKVPDRHLLDKILPDKPVYLSSWDIHTAWVNKKALELIGYDRNTPNLENGFIEHFPDGELSGILREPGAFDPVQKLAIQSGDSKAALRKYLKEAAKYGVTSLGNVQPYGGLEEKEVFEVYKEMEEEGLLTSRIHLFGELKKDLTDAKEYAKKYCSKKLCFAGLKKITDGICESHTGYLLEPYTDDPMTKGELQVTPEELTELIMNADSEGFNVRLHCIGDGAVRNALDCFEAVQKVNGRKNLHNAIEHIENCHPEDIARFAKLGVIASMQPMHIIQNTDEYLKLVGKKRLETTWPMRDLIDAGTIMAFGTDFPVIGLNPMEGIYAAITRQTFEGYPEGGFVKNQSITLGEALKAYTYGPAYVENCENELGTLNVGNLADIVVLDKNLFTAKPKEILETKVLMTMVGGEVIHSEL